MSALALAAPATSWSQAATAAAPPAGASDKPVGYVLGPEDVIDVEIPGRADFKVHARIAQDGTVQVPYLRTVTAANRTTRQLGEEIGRALEAGGYFTRPVVSVEIASFASRNATVLGSVASPGVVPIDRPYRLSEIMARVGGVRDDGADYVMVRSADGKEKKLAIKDLATGGAEQDPPVLPGDKIFVPKAELFYVSGQVKAPGSYPMGSDMTLRMAIAKGGGVTDQGSEGRIKVTRGGTPVRLGLDGKIQSGDVIVVGERLF